MTTQSLDPVLLNSQYPQSAPTPAGLTTDTNTIAPDIQSSDRMKHCDENVYNLNPESHFMRFAKALIGASGAGQVRSKLLVARLGQNIYGMHFFDLDRFYGSIFGFKRLSAEDYTGINPYTDVLTSDQWTQLQAQDASYRSRIIQFGQAVNLCPTPQGLVQAAEALLTVDCDIYEVFSLLDQNQSTYTGVVTDGTLYGRAGNSRGEFVIRPKRLITEEERYALIRTLSPLKPAGSLLTVDPNGVAVNLPITLRGVAADSNYWEVTKTVTPQEEVRHLYPFNYNTPGPWELPRPPFRQYQGEAWSYISDVSVWNAYAYDVNGVFLNALNWDRAVWRNGNIFDYVPAFGIIDIRDVFYGRSVSDGIMVNTPYPGFYSGLLTSVSPLYIDRFPAGPLVDYLRSRFQGDVIPTSNRFWATPARVMEDDTQEVFELSFVGERLINHLSFSLAHYPHQAAVYYNNSEMEPNTWVPLQTTNGYAVNVVVSDSSPDRFSPLPYDYLGHPQHYGDDHWVAHSTSVLPVNVKTIRVVLQRVPGGPPLEPNADAQGLSGWNPAPYSLGLFNFDVGYRVYSRNDLPLRRNEPFSTTIDIVGSRLQISAKEHLAKDLVDGSGPWKSDMLPTKNSVVNFYVDTRDSQGIGQLIDKFFIDPLYVGPNINLYYSNDDPTSGFNADDDAFPISAATVTNTPVGVPGQWLDLNANNASIIINNQAIQFDPRQSWWLGMDLLPQFYSNDGVTRVFAFAGGLYLAMVGGRIGLYTGGAVEIVGIPAPSWGTNQPVRVVCGYAVDPNDVTDPTSPGSYFIRVQRATDAPVGANAPMQSNVITTVSTSIRIGAVAPYASNVFVAHAILKMETISQAAVDAFFMDPMGVTNKPMYASQPDYTPNSVLRLCKDMIDPMMTDSTMQYGIVGGPGEFWNSLQWDPVSRDYQMQKGYMTLPPTKAKFFKFEISNLVPEQYEVFTQTERTVSTTHTETTYTPGRAITVVTGVVATTGPIYRILGVNAAMANAFHVNYYDGFIAYQSYYNYGYGYGGPGYAYGGFGGAPPRYGVAWVSPTAAYTIAYPNAIVGQQYRVSIGIVETLPIAVTRTYTTTQTIEDVITTTKTGFVCGLNKITAYRLDFSATDDSSDYVEHYHDDQHIASLSGLTHVNNSLMSNYGSESTFGEAVSTTFGSSLPVHGVQFATMQTPPAQLLTDPNFVDTLTNNWTLIGDATGTAAPDHGADIARTGVARTYGSEGPTYGAMETSTYGALEVQSGGGIGGLASEPTVVSSSGRIVASATVSTLTALSGPLHLQLISEDGIVLAEDVASLSAGESRTMKLSYTAGSVTVPLTYGAVEGTLYSALDATTYGSHESRPITGPVTLRVIQNGISSDMWTVHAMNMWDDAISWEFSVDDGATWYRAVDIKNNPSGIITFPTPGKQLRYRIRFYRDNLAVSGLHIKPWYVSSDLAMLPRMPIVPAGPDLTPPPPAIVYEPMYQPQMYDIIPEQPAPVQPVGIGAVEAVPKRMAEFWPVKTPPKPPVYKPAPTPWPPVWRGYRK